MLVKASPLGCGDAPGVVLCRSSGRPVANDEKKVEPVALAAGRARPSMAFVGFRHRALDSGGIPLNGPNVDGKIERSAVRPKADFAD